MDRYYYDYRAECVVKNLDTTILAPELYFEIDIGPVDAVKEKWFGTVNGEDVYVECILDLDDNKPSTSRIRHFEKHNFMPMRLVRRSLPAKVFGKEVLNG